MGRLIAWRTHSEFSHVAIYLEDYAYYEAYMGEGVVKTKDGIERAKPHSEIYIPLHIRETTALIVFLEEQVGKGYDYKAIVSFVGNSNKNEKGKYICSELVQHALQKIGYLKPTKLLSPGELYLILHQIF